MYGLMVEPTECYSQAELDRFVSIVTTIHEILEEHPEVLKTVPHFTPVDLVDEVSASKNLTLSETLGEFLPVLQDRMSAKQLESMDMQAIKAEILKAHQSSQLQ